MHGYGFRLVSSGPFGLLFDLRVPRARRAEKKVQCT